MAERFTSDLVFILVVLIVAALLGFIIGYLCKKNRLGKYIKLVDENEQLKVRLEACLKQKEMTVIPFDAAAAQAVYNKKIHENDLKIVEGIGEKIESLLKMRGIDTWYKLSQIPENEIKDILLTDGGSAYKIHETKTWPTQAFLAYEGKWVQLKELQDQLTGGR
jgi:predicted flap endonuclease-1-like 5' DNA nuclease